MPVALPSSSVETHTVGGSVVATIDAAAISNGTIDFLGNVITVMFTVGTPAGNAFAPSHLINKQFQLMIDTSTGNWSTSAGTSGTLTPTQLTSLLNNQRALKNGLEQLATLIGLLSGTFTAWV